MVALIVACFLLSGATGLLYEVIWGRYLALFIGTSTYAHTVVLATFMGGLALGNHLFGRVADRSEGLLRLYAILELGIGVYCALFPRLLPVLGEVYVAVGSGLGPDSVWVMPLKLLLGALVLLPPTTLMGGTLPVLGRYLVREEREIGSRIGTLYFLNTAGAVAGCFLAGFVLMEAWGLELSMIAGAMVNVAIGLAFLAVARREARGGEPARTTPEVAAPPRWSPRQVRWALWAIAAAGGLSMLYELVWFRLVALVFGSSSQSFSVMLMTFIGGIALGGLIVSRAMKRRPDLDALRWFAWCEVGIAASVLVLVPLYEYLPTLFAWMQSMLSRTNDAFRVLQSWQILVLGALMAVPTTLIGMTLPLCTRVRVESVQVLGRGVGHVFSINTLGTLVGATLTGIVLIPTLGLQPTLYLGIVSSAALGMGLLVVSRSSRHLAALTGTALAGAFTLVIASVGAWDYALLTVGFFRPSILDRAEGGHEAIKARLAAGKLMFQTDGVDATVVIYDEPGARMMKINGKTDASDYPTDMATQLMSGHLPMLLHPGKPREVLVVGLGSGVTAHAVLAEPEARVTLVEISSSVVEAARWFEHVNGGVLDDPRFELVVGDAKDHLLLDPRQYDVIISEPSNPWIAGIAQLFSVEFFEMARSRLAPNGLYVQWMQNYQFDDQVTARVLRTLRAAFPEVTVWRMNQSDVLVVSSANPLRAEPARIEAGLRLPARWDQIGPGSFLDYRSPADLLAGQVMSAGLVSRHFPPQEPLNSDFFPWLEYEARRCDFRRDTPRIMDELDERMVPPAHSRLLLAEIVRQAPLDAPTLRRVRHSAMRNVQKRMAASTELALAALGEPVAGSRAAILLDQVRILTAAPGDVAPATCAQLVEQLAELLVAGRSVLYLPDPAPLDALVARCVRDHPEQAPALKTLVAEALWGLGSLDRAIEVAREAAALAAPAHVKERLVRLVATVRQGPPFPL
jgi:spermidine synthase